MNTIRFTSLAALLLTACAAAPERTDVAQTQNYGGWVDQFHEPRGYQDCKATTAGAAFQQCIHGWHERIWVPDLSAPGLPKAP